MTDISTGWTVNRSVRNKAATWVFEALEHVTAVFPFPIIGIDSDNGSEFINEHLLAYCHAHQITFTRSRPGNKNDGAHVEQKNWVRVRELVGYLRYDTAAELDKLKEIWELDRTFTNYLLAQQKLIEKQRHGAKVTKKHDAPATPHQRAFRHEKMRKRPIIQMNAAFKQIKPAASHATSWPSPRNWKHWPWRRNQHTPNPSTGPGATTSRRRFSEKTKTDIRRFSNQATNHSSRRYCNEATGSCYAVLATLSPPFIASYGSSAFFKHPSVTVIARIVALKSAAAYLHSLIRRLGESKHHLEEVPSAGI